MTSYQCFVYPCVNMENKMAANATDHQDVQSTPTSKGVEQRAVIKHCVKAGMTPTATLNFLKLDSSSNATRTIVFDWHKRFRDGGESVADKPRAGRPSVDAKTVSKIRDIIAADRRTTVPEIAEIVDISIGSVHNILTKQLNLHKVSARWIPRLLSDYDKERRVRASEAFLKRYRKQGRRFLDRIITVDETWLHHFDPESKRESLVWKTPDSPPPKKARVVKSTKKHMFIFFADNKGMLLQHAVPDGQTVNKEYYQKVVRRDLLNAIRKKRPGAEIENLIFHQDNAPSHRARDTILTIDFIGFERIEHPPYSPDLAPMDFAIFPRLKAELRGIHFDSLNELQMTVRSIISTYDAKWYTEIFDKWIMRHRKCVDLQGDYVEK